MDWFLMENPIKTDDLGVAPWIGNLHIAITSMESMGFLNILMVMVDELDLIGYRISSL